MCNGDVIYMQEEYAFQNTAIATPYQVISNKLCEECCIWGMLITVLYYKNGSFNFPGYVMQLLPLRLMKDLKY